MDVRGINMKEQLSSVTINSLSKNYSLENEELNVLSDINLDIQEGEFICIVGKSGCGKSTLLRIIAGLEHESSGEITRNGNKITKPSIECGMVFQNARLFPWRTVEQNIAFGVPRHIKKKERKELVQSYIDLVGLTGFEKALPKQLSGGMQQRASIARSLVNNPQILLLDEPFGALDAFTKLNMQNEVMRIWEHEKKTMILVTHDIDEAIYLADRIVVLSSLPGQVKSIIPVNLPRPRIRTDEDFGLIRKKVYAEFFDEHKKEVEYYI